MPTGALALENTHNVAGGRVFGRERLDPVLAWARDRGLPVHLDGARIWNAATALDVAPAELARGFDTVMACLSKGLGAPVGSVLCSSAERIEEALGALDISLEKPDWYDLYVAARGAPMP